MASVQQHYNQWSSTYDEVENKTRDLERKAGQEMLADVNCETLLEIGCGTGKNTMWLQEKAKRLLAIDLSEGMLKKAKEKVQNNCVAFLHADITRPWTFANEPFDLITCSLILEHISDLEPVFEKAAKALREKGRFYICELHPYKQYTGSKARFETAEGLQVLECFVHHVSDYMDAASKNNFSVAALQEWFDEDDRNQPPRLISFLFQKP